MIETVTQPSRYYVGVTMHRLPRMHYFSVPNSSFVKHDYVLVDTPRGLELGQLQTDVIPMKQYPFSFQLEPILKKANAHDIEREQKNYRDAKIAFQFCKEAVQNLNLPMDIINATYNFDQSKLYFNFSAEDRVDFRELLRVLASQFQTRIDLRQIGARDRAKLYGGIGICGLPLCCTTFLNEFDNISITRAKNQMLTLNIPKLTGHCGKLLCCLKYEDDAYTELKVSMPRTGDKYHYLNHIYRVSSMNVLSRIVKLENSDRDIQFVHVDVLNQLNKVTA
jgi:cell fate regulator YaaT (PSP1 superfamily)